MIHSWILCKTLLLSDSCRWLVEEEDAKAVGRVIINYHRPLTKAFMETIGVVAAPLAHASKTVSQRGSSNL